MKGMFTAMVRHVEDNVFPFLRLLPGRIVGFFAGALSLLWQTGSNIMQGLWNGLSSKWDQVKSWLSRLNPVSWFNDINPKKGHAIRNLVSTGEDVMRGLNLGMMDGWNANIQWLKHLDPSTQVNFAGVAPDTGLTTNNENGQTFQFGDIISQADPEEIADAISWAVRMS